MTNEEKFISLEKLEKNKDYKKLVKNIEKENEKLEEKIWDSLLTKNKINKTKNDIELVYYNVVASFIQKLVDIKDSEVLIEQLEERAQLVKNNIINATKPSSDSPFDISRDNLEFSENDMLRFERKYNIMNISMLKYLKNLYNKTEETISEDIY